MVNPKRKKKNQSPKGVAGSRVKPPKDGKPARPTVYSHKLASEVCERIANELVSVQDIVGNNYRYPDARRLHRWLSEEDDFKEMYAVAKELQAELAAFEQLKALDVEPVDMPTVALAKARAEAKRWSASKLSPKKWGNSVKVAGDEDNPISIRSWADLASIAENES